MKSRSLRRSVRYEGDQTGCIWGFMSIFDFRHGRSTRRLLSNRRHWNRHTVVDGHSGTKFNTLRNVDDKCQSIEDGEECVIVHANDTKTSVKELMEEEMFNEEPKKQRDSDELEPREFGSKHERHVRKNSKRTRKHRKKFCEIQDCSFDATRGMGPENSSRQVTEEKTSTNIDLEVVMEELCLVHGCVKHDDHNMQSNEVYSIDEEKINAAIKVFANQRFNNGKDGDFDHTKGFMDVLHSFSSHKELEKDRNSNSLGESNMLSEELCNSKPEAFVTNKHHNFFRRKRGSQKMNPLKENAKCQPSSRIVILKPGSVGLRNSGNEIDVRASVQSHDTMRNKVQSQKNVSHFSFTEIKRKLKHAMGKEQHGILPMRTTRGFPREHQQCADTERTVGVEDGGWSSPNRNHFYIERYVKPSIGKRGDKIGKLKNFEPSMVSETTGCPEQGVSDIYIKAKKHLSEMLTNGDENAELLSWQLPKALGRVLSLPEYNFSPSDSPWKDREHRFVTAQMRLSPHSNFHMVSEDTQRLMPENHAVSSSPSGQNFENVSFITDESPDEKVESPTFDVDAHEFNHNKSVDESLGSIRDVIRSEGVKITKTVDTGHVDENEALDVSSEQSSSSITRDLRNCDSAEVCDEERFSQCSKLDKFEDQVSSSPLASPSSSFATRKIEDPDSAIDRTERPSPISVLEPLFTEDNDISPLYPAVGSAGEWPQIHFEEQVSSATDQGICMRTCIENEESAFEYVEALLLGSDLNWDEYLLRWLSFNQPLNPSLFGEVEVDLFSNRFCHDQKLLFDCTNEVLNEVCERYFGWFPHLSFGKQSIRPVPKRMKLINEVWEGVKRHLLQLPTPRSLDQQLFMNDMMKSVLWMNLQFDIEHIGSEVEEAVLEDLMEETIVTFVKDGIEGEVSVLPNLNENESSVNL